MPGDEVDQVARLRPLLQALGLGGQGSVNLVPPPLESFYGTRRPLGGAVFLRIGLAVRGQPIMEMPGMK